MSCFLAALPLLDGKERLAVFDRLAYRGNHANDFAGALKSYQDSLTVADRLVKSEPDNPAWQESLALRYAHLADAYRRSGDARDALLALKQGKVIMDRLMKLSPDNPAWKNMLGWFSQELAIAQK